MATKDRFPTYDLDQADTTPAQQAAARQACDRHPDATLLAAMLGLDGAPMRPQQARKRYRPNRPREDVPADRTILADGWSRDPHMRARVHAQVADLTAQGLTVNETARRVGLSSRGVQRLRTNQQQQQETR